MTGFRTHPEQTPDYTPGCRSVQGWVKRALDEAIEKGITELLHRQ